MAWNDVITEKQLQMIWSLKTQLGLNPCLHNIQQINRRKAQMLIDGLLEEVNALPKDDDN
jgi:tRNA A37 N6-isopentenylltransferase MiaA